MNNLRNNQDPRQLDQNKDIINENNNQQKDISMEKPRKNRTLQYYKFLFYSMKVEIQSTELVNIIKSSNSSEILLWILSAMLHNKFQGVFLWFHILHLIRGFLGFFILYKMPRSNELVEAMESEKFKKDRETKIFNDYTRKIINLETFEKAKSLKCFMLIYMILTILNIFIDLLDLISGLSKFDDKDHSNSDKINICTNFFIVCIYLGKNNY